MKKFILLFVATVCFALYSSAAVAKKCDPYNKAEELRILALNIYHESRGESPLAMQMIGEVTLNRVESVNYPNSICEVVYQRGQFSWTRKKNQTPSEKEAWILSLRIAERLLNGNVRYIDNGATHFLNPSNVSDMPSWTHRFKKVGKYGKHIFYDDRSRKINIYMSHDRRGGQQI